MRRWAVYWTPEPPHPLWRAGCDWLGRDPSHAGAGTAPPDRDTPWRYGFHATLKAPMALRAGTSAAHFLSAVHALAVHTEAFEMPPLRIAWLAGFLALRPREPLDAAHPLRRLADACVRELDEWRAPASAARGETTLDAEQRLLLARWGYPHVFARWRFHLTLTDPVPAHDAERRHRLEDEAKAHFAAALAAPLHARSLCVFLEERAGTPLRLTHRMPLAP
jgi:hypothetical protein